MTQNTKVILITGAGAGIGMALSRKLVNQGHQVYAGVRDLKRAIRDYAGDAKPPHLLQLDVTRQSQINRSIKEILKKQGRIDTLVNNAGFGMYGAFEELSDRQFRKQYETNVFAPLALCRAVIPVMRAQQSGSIINVSSILGLLSIPTGSAYVSSKYALEGFSESLRYELSPFGIRVVLIEPGLIRTNFKKNMQLSKKADKQSSPYRFLNHLLADQEYRGLTTAPEAAARRIAKVINKKQPAIRYRVGLDSHLAHAFISLTPDWLMDGLMRFVLQQKYRAATKSSSV